MNNPSTLVKADGYVGLVSVLFIICIVNLGKLCTDLMWLAINKFASRFVAFAKFIINVFIFMFIMQMDVTFNPSDNFLNFV